MARTSYINTETIQNLVIFGWERSVERAFDDGVLSREEEERLAELMSKFSLNQQQLDQNGAYSKVVKGAILRDVCDGKVPDRLNVDGQLPMNFMKSESLVWVFQNVAYFEEKVRSHYVGGSSGASIRVAKGLYFRTSAFKGERVQTTSNEHIDTGLLAVTSKHIYFAGDRKRFRIRYDKIVAFEPYEDGLGVHRDLASAKQQTFTLDDGWFAYNLITNLARL